MLDVYSVSLNWTGLLLAIGIAMGGPSGMAPSRIVPRVSGTRRRNILQAIGVTMVVTYLEMTLTDSIPLLMVITLVNCPAERRRSPALSATFPSQIVIIGADANCKSHPSHTLF